MDLNIYASLHKRGTDFKFTDSGLKVSLTEPVSTPFSVPVSASITSFAFLSAHFACTRLCAQAASAASFNLRGEPA